MQSETAPSSSEPISVGIPCHNEAQSLNHTVRSVLSQRGVTIGEIIICLSGCTDGTESLAESLSRRHERIRVIESPRGKPNAWNRIREAASHRYILFIDGDVLLSPEAVFHLFTTLRARPEAIAAGSIPVALVPRRTWILRQTHTDAVQRHQPVTLWGSGYLVDTQALAARMSALGVESMPEDIIADGAWITFVIGREHIVFDQRAEFYFLGVTSLADYLRMHSRYSSSSCQLDSEYVQSGGIIPPEADRLKSPVGGLREKYESWRRLPDTPEKAFIPFLYIAVRFARALAHRWGRFLYRTNRHTNRWKPVKATKNGQLLQNLYNDYHSNNRASN